MKKKYYLNSKDYINRWIISYADLVTLLLALFMMFFAMTNVNIKNYRKEESSIHSNNIVDIEGKGEGSRIRDSKGIETIKEVSSKDMIFEIIKKEFGSKANVEILSEKRGVIIRFNNTIFFDSGSAKIKVEAMSTLDEVARMIKFLDNPILVEGHTDSQPIIGNGKYGSNWDLSTARAVNIIKILTHKYNISPKRLSAIGYGQYMPIADNTTFNGRIKNRRVDIIVLSEDS